MWNNMENAKINTRQSLDVLEVNSSNITELQIEKTETASISTLDIKVSDFERKDFEPEQWNFIEKKVNGIKAPVNKTIANNYPLLFPSHRAVNKLPGSTQDVITEEGNTVKVKVLPYETTRGKGEANIISNITFTLPFQEIFEPHFGSKVAVTYENILKYAIAEKTLEPEFKEANFVKRIGGTDRDYAELDNRLKFLTYASYEIKTLVKVKIRGKEQAVKYEEVGHLVNGYRRFGDIYKVSLNLLRHQHILAISKGEKPTDYVRIEGTQSRENAIQFYLDTKKGLGKVYPLTVRFVLSFIIGISKKELYHRSIIFLAELLDNALKQVKGWDWEVDTGKLELSNSVKNILSSIPKTGWIRLITFLKENKTEIDPLAKKDFLKLKVAFKEIHQETEKKNTPGDRKENIPFGDIGDIFNQ
jgi:hypothetical protein